MGELIDPQGAAPADAAVIANGDGASAAAVPMGASSPRELPLPPLFEELGQRRAAAAPDAATADTGDGGDPTHPRLGVSLVTVSGAIFGAALGSLAGQEGVVVGAVLGAVAGWFAGRR